VPFGKFLLGSFVGRIARFMAVAIIVHMMGNRAKEFIDRYFNKIVIVGVFLVILGFYLVGRI